MLSTAYGFIGNYDEAKKWCLAIYRTRDQMTVNRRIWKNLLYDMYLEKTKYNEIKYLKQGLEIDDQSCFYLWKLGRTYCDLYQYENAIPDLEKALEICSKWEFKPPFFDFYVDLGIAYHNTGMYKKEKELYKKAEQDFSKF